MAPASMRDALQLNWSIVGPAHVWTRQCGITESVTSPAVGDGDGLELGITVSEVHELTRMNRRFLSKLHHVHSGESTLRTLDVVGWGANPSLLREAKQLVLTTVRSPGTTSGRVIPERPSSCRN